MFGRAVRALPDTEYDLILRAGFATLLPTTIQPPMNEHVPGLMEEPSTFDRPIVERVIARPFRDARSEEHTSELQSLMRISYAVFCLKKKTEIHTQQLPHI